MTLILVDKAYGFASGARWALNRRLTCHHWLMRLLTLLLTCSISIPAFGTTERFTTFKIEPAQWAAYDYLTGDFATLDVETSEIYIYARGYFEGDKSAVRGPWRAKTGQKAIHLAFAYTPDKTWLAVALGNEPSVALLDPQSLEPDSIIRLGNRKPIKELNSVTDPVSSKLCYQSGGKTGLIDLKLKTDEGVIDAGSSNGLISSGLLPSHDGSILYCNHIAVAAKGVSAEMLNQNNEELAVRVISDKQQLFATTGYAILAADYSRTITEFDFLIYDFASDGSVVAGIDYVKGDPSITLCIASMSDYETLDRVPLPALFSKSPPAGYRQVGSDDFKGHYAVFLDVQAKRVLTFHSGWVTSYDYSHLKLPAPTANLALIQIKLPSAAFIGQRYEIPLSLPEGTTLAFDEKLKGISVLDNVLIWDVHASDQGQHQFRIESIDGMILKSFPVSVDWESFTFSIRDSGAFLDEDFDRRQRHEQFRVPPITDLAADNDLIAVWYAKTLMLFDFKTGTSVWANRFDTNIMDVCLGKRHLYVELAESLKSGVKIPKVHAVSRDGAFAMSEVPSLSGNFESSSFGKLVYLDGVVIRDGLTIAANGKATRGNACLDSTVETFAGDSPVNVVNGHVANQGFEFETPSGKPALLVAAERTNGAFEREASGILGAALGPEFFPATRPPPSVKSAERCERRELGVIFTPEETNSSKGMPGTRLGIHPIDPLRIPRSVQIISKPQGVAQIAANDTHVIYCREDVIYKIPFSQIGITPIPDELRIEHRQSTFLADREASTVLNYKITGGRAPYEFRAACWLSGEKPDSIEQRVISSLDGSVQLSIPAAELSLAATAFLADRSNRELIRSFVQKESGGDQAAFDAKLANFTALQTPQFLKAIGRPPTGLPIPLPIRIQVFDSEDNETYLGHYIFYELDHSGIEKTLQAAAKRR